MHQYIYIHHQGGFGNSYGTFSTQQDHLEVELIADPTRYLELELACNLKLTFNPQVDTIEVFKITNQPFPQIPLLEGVQLKQS